VIVADRVEVGVQARLRLLTDLLAHQLGPEGQQRIL
jgi:hypothetical protein